MSVNVLTKKFHQTVVSLIRKFDERVSGIPDTFEINIEEPDFNTPDHVKKCWCSSN